MLKRLTDGVRRHPLGARLGVVFLVALAVRVLAAVVLHSALGTQVTDAYDVIGRNLVDGFGFSYQPQRDVPTVTRAPFYPAFWAVLEWSGLPFLGYRLAEAVVDSGTAVLVAVLAALLAARRLGGGTVSQTGGVNRLAVGTRAPAVNNFALIAGLVYALQPFTVYYTVKLGSETWFTFWLVVTLVCFCIWVDRFSLVSGCCLGAALGVFMLNKSVGAGLLPLLVVLGFWWRRPASVKRWLGSAVLVIVFGVGLVAPWLIRNYAVTGGFFVPVQTLTWWNFWYDFDFTAGSIGQGVSDHYGPAGGMPYSLSAPADAAQEAQFQAEAFEWISSNPTAAARKIGRNLAEFWYLTEGVVRSRIALLASFVQIMLSVVGLTIAWRWGWPRPVLLAIVLVAYFMAAYALVFSVFRYSLVVVPILSIAEAVVIMWLLRGRVSSPQQAGASKA